LVPGTISVLKKIFLKVIPNAANENFLGPKITYSEQYKYPKRNFFEIKKKMKFSRGIKLSDE
jgi:hypothetical protein